MELLDRYVRAVKTHLPREQQDDIVRELSENLRAQIEDREAELGRPLSEVETVAMLGQHGNPAVVAARYRGNERSLVVGRRLIGPELFPFYVRILALNSGLTLLACIAVILVLAEHWPLGRIVSQTLLNLVIQSTIVTSVFVAAERHLTRNPGDWMPRELRPGGLNRETVRRPSRGQPIFELVVLMLASLWWLALPNYLRPFFSGASATLAPGPSWSLFYVSLLVLTIAQMVPTFTAIVRPQWTRFRAAARAIIQAASAAAGFVCAGIGRWLVATGAAEPNAPRKLDIINRWCSIGVVMFAVICVFLTLLEARKLMRMQRDEA